MPASAACVNAATAQGRPTRRECRPWSTHGRAVCTRADRWQCWQPGHRRQRAKRPAGGAHAADAACEQARAKARARGGGRQGSSRARKRRAILRPNSTERARYCLQRLLSYFDRGIGALKSRSARGLLIMQESGSIDIAAENFKLIEVDTPSGVSTRSISSDNGSVSTVCQQWLRVLYRFIKVVAIIIVRL